jgi:hypothetical protein
VPTFNTINSCSYTRQGVDVPFSTLRNGSATNNNPLALQVSLTASAVSNQYSALGRVIFPFDTHTLSPLLVGNMIGSANIQIKISTPITNTLLSDVQGGINIVESLIKDTIINNSKFLLSNLSLATIANSFNFSQCINGSILTFNLNPSGIATIVTNGVSVFAVLLNADTLNLANWSLGQTCVINMLYGFGAVLTVNIVSSAGINYAVGGGSGSGGRKRLRRRKVSNIINYEDI